MNNNEKTIAVCEEAIARVRKAIDNHRSGKPECLDIPALQQVMVELIKMVKTLDSKKYSPSYGRFLLDWPDNNGLVDYLLDVSHKYKKWV